MKLNLFDYFRKIDNSKNKDLELVYKSETGHEFYAYKNILDISPSRGVSAARADRFVGMKLSEANLGALVDMAIDGINKENNFVQATAILHLIKYRQEFLCEENSLLDLSSVYYFLKDEDPEFPSDHHIEVKRQIWSKDAKCKSFFLHCALALTKRFSDTPEEDLMSFLTRTTDMSDRIYQFIPRS